MSNLKLRKRARRGTTLVEFALIVPILLTLMFGVMEFGYNAYTRLQIDNATRDGARRAALDKSISDIKARIISEAKVNPAITTSEILIVYSSDSGTTWTTMTDDSANSGHNISTAGNLVRVTVNHPYKTLTGFFPFMKNLTIQSIVTIRQEV